MILNEEKLQNVYWDLNEMKEFEIPQLRKLTGNIYYRTVKVINNFFFISPCITKR
jgi:hypothetical protein